MPSRKMAPVALIPTPRSPWRPWPKRPKRKPVVVQGFYIDPPEYPALPEVEGTRINSGKKTSFVKPEEFPTIKNNNYREAHGNDPRSSS